MIFTSLISSYVNLYKPIQITATFWELILLLQTFQYKINVDMFMVAMTFRITDSEQLMEK